MFITCILKKSSVSFAKLRLLPHSHPSSHAGCVAAKRYVRWGKRAVRIICVSPAARHPERLSHSRCAFVLWHPYLSSLFILPYPKSPESSYCSTLIFRPVCVSIPPPPFDLVLACSYPSSLRCSHFSFLNGFAPLAACLYPSASSVQSFFLLERICSVGMPLSFVSSGSRMSLRFIEECGWSALTFLSSDSRWCSAAPGFLFVPSPAA